MNEQQRLFLAVGLCVIIFVVWQLLLPAPPPAKQPPAKQPVATTKPEPAPQQGVDAVAGQGEAPDAAGTVSPAPAPVPVETRTIANELVRAQVTNTPLSLKSLELLQYEQRPEDGDKESPGPVNLVTAQRDGQPYQAGIEWTGGAKNLGPLAFEDNGNGVTLSGGSQQLQAQVRIAPRPKRHIIDYTLQLTNRSNTPVPVGANLELGLQIPEGEGGMFSGPGVVSTGICQTPRSLERFELDDVDDETFSAPSAKWVALDQQYFVVSALADADPARKGVDGCTIRSDGRTLLVDYVLEEQIIQPGQSWERTITLYAGPKLDDALKAVTPGMEDIIDYDIWGIPLGFIARPMVFLLDLFHGWVNSWGIAIILLTLTVKLLLFPVTYKSAVGMRQMQLLKPELDKLKERFPDDRERQQMEQLKLFKERGVNPLQGCLPMLLQMPVWFALYRALWSATALYRESFLWLPDLTAQEPGFPFLALGLGVVFFGQQLLTPITADNQQAKMMRYLMPVMFTFFMFALPSGLVLYIFVNTVLSVLQQLVINRSVGPAPAAAPGGSSGGAQPKDKSGGKKGGGGKGGRKSRAAKATK